MPEAFKNRFNPKMIGEMASHLERVGGQRFNCAVFEQVSCEGLEELEMKERSNQIVRGLKAALPKNYLQAVQILTAALGPAGVTEDLDFQITKEGIAGWAVTPMADYVACYGQENFSESLAALREMTMRLTCEFAIRPFLDAEPEKTMAVMLEWARDENLHVRRLASEGSRPRLPWGLRLQKFDREPAPVLELLELLKDDNSRYVRRSVANSLNDIAKMHPDLITSLAKEWLQGACKERQALVRHACRTLIKDGHAATLAAFGYGKPQVEVRSLAVEPAVVAIGEAVVMTAQIESQSKEEQSLVVDYALYFARSGGKTSRKVFKWKTFSLAGREDLVLEKSHSFRVVTTRVYYPGAHAVELLINGESYGRAEFELV